MKKLLATAALAVIATSAMTSCQDTKATSGNGATDYTQYVNPLMGTQSSLSYLPETHIPPSQDHGV